MRVSLRPVVPIVFLLCCRQALADNNSISAPTYEVIKTDTPPVLDGVVSPGEWDAASAAAGDWVDLRTHEPDKHNLRFRMLWDDTALYLLGETDYDGFLEPTDYLGNPDLNHATYSPNLYIDPDADDELLLEDGSYNPDYTVDGYQIAWSIDEGFSSRMPTLSDEAWPLRDPLDEDGDLVNDYISGLFLEAHADVAFGNNALLDLGDDGPNGNYRDDKHPELMVAMRADNEDLNETGQPGGIWEVKIGWEFFDAADPDNPDFTGIDFGLFHPQAPEDGDVWAFEAAVITPDAENLFPSWSEPLGGDEGRTSFAPPPADGHGRITFVSATADPLDCNGDSVVDAGDLACACASGIIEDLLTELDLLAGDLNGDGSVGFPDFLTLSANFGSDVDSYTEGDINCDGSVGFPDFLTLGANFGQMAGGGVMAAAVPEPSTVSLLLLGMLLGVARRRRR